MGPCIAPGTVRGGVDEILKHQFEGETSNARVNSRGSDPVNWRNLTYTGPESTLSSLEIENPRKQLEKMRT